MSEIKDPKFGKEAKDKVTGFAGIITSKVSFLTGCDQYGITPPAKDGKTNDTAYFDVKRVEVTGPGISIEEIVDKKDPGGPNRDAPKI